MRPVHVGVGHDHDTVVPQLREVEVLPPDAASQGRDHGLDLVAAQHLVEPRLLDVEDLALDREDGLEAAIPPLLGGAAGRFSLDDVDLATSRVAFLTVGQLAGQCAVVEGALPPHEVARLARRLAGARRVDCLVDDPLGDRRVLFEVRAQPVVDDRLDDPLDLRIAELRLCLPFELRLRDLHADDGDQTFADVVPADALLEVAGEVVPVRVAVDRARQRRPEAGQVGSALLGVDVVGERVDRLRVAVVPLQRDLGVDAFPGPPHVDRLAVGDRLVPVDELDERPDAPLVGELVALVVALVVQRDHDAGIEEGKLAQAVRKRVEAVLDGLEDLFVRPERDLGPTPFRSTCHVQSGPRPTAFVLLAVDVAVAPDFEIERLRQRIDDRYPDPVQPARHLVALVVELAAGVEHGHHDLRGRLAAHVPVDRNAAAVVGDRHGVVDVQRHPDGVAVAGERLVDGVVDHLVHEMMESLHAGGTDVHRRTLADGVEPFENLDLIGTIAVRIFGGRS